MQEHHLWSFLAVQVAGGVLTSPLALAGGDLLLERKL
jgi:hypothetical protein